MVLRCDRCETTRYDGIDARGDVGGRRYVYTDAYRYPRDEAPSRSDLRLRMLAPPAERRRHLDAVPEVDQGDAALPQDLADGAQDEHARPVEAPASGGAA
jgi:hypothetical protein